MNVDKELVKHVADVARITLKEKELSSFVKDFNEILDMFSKLDMVDTNNVKPSFHPVEIRNVLREDKVEKSLSQEEALSNSSNKKDGYFKGPKAV